MLSPALLSPAILGRLDTSQRAPLLVSTVANGKSWMRASVIQHLLLSNGEVTSLSAGHSASLAKSSPRSSPDGMGRIGILSTQGRGSAFLAMLLGSPILKE